MAPKPEESAADLAAFAASVAGDAPTGVYDHVAAVPSVLPAIAALEPGPGDWEIFTAMQDLRTLQKKTASTKKKAR